MPLRFCTSTLCFCTHSASASALLHSTLCFCTRDSSALLRCFCASALTLLVLLRFCTHSATASALLRALLWVEIESIWARRASLCVCTCRWNLRNNCLHPPGRVGMHIYVCIYLHIEKITCAAEPPRAARSAPPGSPRRLPHVPWVASVLLR